jgi:hypothetical protein
MQFHPLELMMMMGGPMSLADGGWAPGLMGPAHVAAIQAQARMQMPQVLEARFQQPQVQMLGPQLQQQQYQYHQQQYYHQLVQQQQYYQGIGDIGRPML